MKNTRLVKEEQNLLDTVERGEWKSVKNVETEKKRYQAYARAHASPPRHRIVDGGLE